MAKTVFDSSELKRAERQQELEAELDSIQADHKKKNTVEASHSVQAEKSRSHKSSATEHSSARSETLHHHVLRSPKEYSQVLRDEKSAGGMFSSFVAQPKNMRFENQQENEQVLLVLRQHPILNVTWVVVAILLGLAPLLVFPILPIDVVFPGIFGFFATVVWYLLVGAFIIESFLHWYFNIYILTDERIIDVDFFSLIYKEVSEAKIDKIEDVTATTAGFLGAIFDFGTISIQTAAEKRQFEFVAVPQPAKVTKFLNELMLEEEREKSEGRVM